MSLINENRFPDKAPYVCGHRGVMYEEPENTLSSFLASAQLGCDAVELDVFLTKCGTLVVFHGDGTDEGPGFVHNHCVDVKGNIVDFTVDEVRQLKVRTDSPAYVCPRDKLKETYIPSLEEVLIALQKTDLEIKIELKGEGTPKPAIELVEKYGMVERCFFSSFYHDRIAEVRKLRPERLSNGEYKYKTGALFSAVPENFLKVALTAGASEVHLKYDTCTKERVEAIHDAGLGSMAWFRGPRAMRNDIKSMYSDMKEEHEDMYKAVICSGVEGVCCNKPDVMLDLIEKEM